MLISLLMNALYRLRVYLCNLCTGGVAEQRRWRLRRAYFIKLLSLITPYYSSNVIHGSSGVVTESVVEPGVEDLAEDRGRRPGCRNFVITEYVITI